VHSVQLLHEGLRRRQVEQNGGAGDHAKHHEQSQNNSTALFHVDLLIHILLCRFPARSRILRNSDEMSSISYNMTTIIDRISEKSYF
jgi:hypothetical protein